MKLCTVTQSYAPTGGGVRTFIHAEREWCARNGIEHVLIAPGAGDGTMRDGLLTLHTVRSPYVPGSNVYRLLLRSRHVGQLLEQERPDVIELHDAYNLPWTAFRHRARHGGVVSAFYMTDLPVAYIESPLRRRVGAVIAGAARSATERYLRRLYRQCDFVTAISPSVCDRLHSFGVAHARTVPLGVDLDTFSPARRSDAVRERLGVAPGELLLIYAGRLDGEKRPDVVLSAFEQLPSSFPARLVIAGDGPMRDALARRAEATGRARVLPFIEDRGEMAALLASGDIYVSAMAHETFGLSVVEAQACGLPVVGVRAGAMIDRVREGEGFLVEPDSPEALAGRIVTMPRGEWRMMGSRARARVEQEFSWSRTFETLHRMYADRLELGPATTRPD